MKKIMLIDGNNLMFRAYYATAYTGNLMQNKKGLYTNAIYGFCMMMTKFLENKPDYVFVAFDTKEKTFRHEIYNEYKEGRKPAPEEFLVQIPYIKKYLQIMKIKQLEIPGYEADDLIATISRLASFNQEHEIQIISGDKDLLQLVSTNVKVLFPKKGSEFEEYNDKNFFEKTGITALQIPDYKGLAGDNSDNLPGIKGIGEKTACKLLEQYHNLENIIAHADSFSLKLQTMIVENQEIGLKCKQLATLKQDIDLDIRLDDLLYDLPDYQLLIPFFQELEFYSLLKKIDLLKETTITKKKEDEHAHNSDVVIAKSHDDFSFLKNSFLYLEVFQDNYYTNQCLGLGILSDEINLFVPFDVLICNQSLHQYLKSDYLKKTFDLKKLYVVLKKNNIEINNVDFDSLLAIYLINPTWANDDLKVCLEHFVETNLHYDDNVYGYKSKAAIPNQNIIADHCLLKCQFLKKTYPLIKQELINNEQNALFTVELALSVVLGQMELNGLKVDRFRLKMIEDDLTSKVNNITQEIYLLAGEKFNINSVKQLGEILFTKLNLPSGKKNKTGFSTNSEVLEKLASDYEIARLLLEYRSLTKIINTYVLGLYEVMSTDDYVHPLYKQALTLTGRLSSVNPNIQNMPIRTEVGQVIRGAFISRFPNGKILSADYSQIELRVLADMANDENMIAAFNSDEDFHKKTASWLYDVSSDQVTKEMRRTAKAINFGIVYGMSAWGLSESIKISPVEATNYINKYFANYQGVRQYLDQAKMDAYIKGYSKTIFNRLRYIPELRNSNKNLVGFGERTAMNSPIQGTAADIIKMAMVEVDKALIGMKSLMIAQVHDELVFDVFPGELEELEKRIKKAMEEVVKLKVALIVDCQSGNNWLEA